MKICPECGMQQPDNNRTCIKCRAYLPPSSKTDMRENFRGLDFEGNRKTSNTFMQDRIRERYGESSSNKNIIGIVRVIIGVLLLIVGIVMVWNATSSMLS